MVDLLRAAGMPLDLERQQLLQQTLTMQQQIKDAQNQLTQHAQVTALLTCTCMQNLLRMHWSKMSVLCGAK